MNRQLASLFLVVPQLISRPFVCCLYASVYERPPSKSHLSWLWYMIVCVSVRSCGRMCLCHGQGGPDGSLDTEDELASALVSMAAAGFIRLSL